jgi:hypothetical protein
VTIEIPPTMKRIEMRLGEDESGVLYLQTKPLGVALCTLREVLSLGWRIVDGTPAERQLLAAHGLEIPP